MSAIFKRFIKNYWVEQPKWYRITFYVLSLILFLIWCLSVYLSTVGAQIPVQTEDSTEYAVLAKSLIGEKSFSLGNNIPETFRTPGYPFFVAIFSTLSGGSFFGVTFIQMLLVLATALLIKRIAENLFSVTVGYICSIIFLVNPLTASLFLFILSDTLFIFLYLFFFWLISEHLEKNLWLFSILGGVIAGAAIYVRPIGLFSLPIFLLPILLSQASRKVVLYAMATIAVIILMAPVPWMLRNYHLTGVFSFTSLTQYNLMMYNFPKFFANHDGIPKKEYIQAAEKSTGISSSSWIYLNKQTTPILENYIYNFFQDNFFAYAKYHTLTVTSFFLSSDINSSIEVFMTALGKEQKPKFTGASQLGSIYELKHGNLGSFFQTITDRGWEFAERLVICFLIICAIYELFKNRKIATWTIVAIIFYLGFLAGPVSSPRYRFPVEPFMLMIAVVGMITLAKSFKLRYGWRSGSKAT